MKTRVQVYLDAEQDRLLEWLSKRLRTTKSRLIRESLARYLEEVIPPEEDPALRLVGLAGEAPQSDLSERHDAFLTEER